MLWYNHMCTLIWTLFSGERCGPWASCYITSRKAIPYKLCKHWGNTGVDDLKTGFNVIVQCMLKVSLLSGHESWHGSSFGNLHWQWPVRMRLISIYIVFSLSAWQSYMYTITCVSSIHCIRFQNKNVESIIRWCLIWAIETAKK